MDDAHDDKAEAGAFLRRLGGRIRQVRRARALSQEELAFAADLTQHYVSQVEQGERNVSVVTLRMVAKALGMSLSELLEGIDEEREDGASGSSR